MPGKLITEASSYLDRQMNNLATKQTTNLPSVANSPTHQMHGAVSQNDKSLISFQLQSNKLNEQSQTIIATSNDPNNIKSNVSPFDSQSPQPVVALPKYEKPKQKFMRKAHESLQKGKEIQMENCYNLKNYRLDNKKFPVGLPGEKKSIFYEKSFEEREKQDNKKVK